MFYTILLYALFASLFSLSKDTLNYSEPFFLIGSRMLFAGLMLLAYEMVFNRQRPTITKEHILSLFLLAFLNIYLTNVAEIWGIQHMDSSKACLIYSLSPFLASIVAFIVLKETLSAKKWLGLIVGFTGLVPIFVIQSPGEQASGNIGFISMAEVALLVAVFCSVYGWILLKKMISHYHYTPLLANGISMTIGGFFALLHSYFSGESWNPFPVTKADMFLQNTLIMCLISNIICYNLYGFLLKRYSATFMSLAGLITPFFAAFFGWYFLGETISWHYFASIGIFSFGLVLFYQEELRENKAKAEAELAASA